MIGIERRKPTATQLIVEAHAPLIVAVAALLDEADKLVDELDPKRQDRRFDALRAAIVAAEGAK